MMPCQIATLYQIERPKTVAEIRLADEHAARVAAALADLVRPFARARRRRRSVPDHMAADSARKAGPAHTSGHRDMMSTTMEVR